MFRKWSTSFCVYNILIATHLQPEYTTNTHETRSEQSIRRRGPIHRAVSQHYQIYISISTNTCFRIIKYAFLFPHFAVVYVSANTIKLCTNVHLQLAMAQQHTQNAYFCIAKTILLQCKNPLFARQKPYFCNAKTPFLVDAYIALIKHETFGYKTFLPKP